MVSLDTFHYQKGMAYPFLIVHFFSSMIFKMILSVSFIPYFPKIPIASIVLSHDPFKIPVFASYVFPRNANLLARNAD